MTTVTIKGNPVSILSDLPALGQKLPDFRLVNKDLGEVTTNDYANKILLLNIFPSLDTGTCAASVRRFNQEAAEHPNVAILCVSADLPFAQARFCVAEDIDKTETLSAYRSSFGKDFGVEMTDGPLKKLLARAVVIADASRRVLYGQLVPEVTEEPDYAAALKALNAA